MSSRVIRDRLVCPVAAILAAGLVYAPAQQPAATVSPRLAEVSALRLQAEVTSLVTGMAGVVGAGQPAAAASSLTVAGPTAASLCTYPCTVFDKLVSKLPEDIRYAILPTLYVVASVLGLLLAPITLVTSALFGWPTSLRPAAAAAPETAPVRKASPAPAAATPVQSDPVSPTVPDQTASADEAAVVTASASDDHRRRPGRQRTAGAVTDPVEKAVSPKAVASGASATADTAPADMPADLITPAVEAATEELAQAEEVADDVTSEVSGDRIPKAASATAPARAGRESPRAATRSVR